MSKAKYQTVEHNGVKFRIENAKLESWRALDLMSKLQDEELDDAEKLAPAMNFIRYVFGAEQIGKIVEMCGGEDAPAGDVIDLAMDIFSQAGEKPKN